MCEEDGVHFVNTFAVTYDPRAVNQGLPAYLPFDLFPRQVELWRWLDDRVASNESGLLEKSRDVGCTYVTSAFALHRWLFVPGFKTTFGSRKVDLVDKLGDPDSIFEKVRLILRMLPPWLRPKGFSWEKHSNHCKITNPENGNVISGEGGDEMGRGGRSACYILDEFSFVSHPETVDAAVIANADCRIYASTVNNPSDLFARKRHDGTFRPDQIFTFRWWENPRHTPAWWEKKQIEFASTPWVLASEYEIDYTAAVEGICIPAAWVRAAFRLGEMIELPSHDQATQKVAGLDVGDTCARSVLQPRFDSVLTPPTSWNLPDTTETALNALEAATSLGVRSINYDTIGVGKGVSSTLAHNPKDGVAVQAVNVGTPPDWRTVWPDGENSRNKFANLKAELWWKARERFRCAAEHLAHLTGETVSGVSAQEHELSDMFVFEPAPRHLYRETEVQLSTPKRLFNATGKIIIESKKQLADRGISSPDFADAVVLSLAVPHESAVTAVSPVVAVRGNPFPELGEPTVSREQRQPAHYGGGFKPAVSTGKRFDQDFARDY